MNEKKHVLTELEEFQSILAIVSMQTMEFHKYSKNTILMVRQHRRCRCLRFGAAVVVLLLLVAPLVRSFGSAGSFGSRRATTTTSLQGLLRELDSVEELQEGSLILSRVESSLGCHDLRQPYFHKAIVLVLDHDPNDFTQGVLLNRASDLVLQSSDIVYVDDDDDDDDERPSPPSSSWRIHFGGDIGGWYEEDPQLLCLHGIATDAALAVSDPIFDDRLFITSHRGALSLVEAGEATSDMFYTFSGFCGWEEGMLQREVDRGSWCLASFVDDNQDEIHPFHKLVENYSWKNPDYKPDSGGLEFWHELMADLGKDGVTTSVLPKNPQPFTDLMVKEWSTQRLQMASKNANGEDAANNNSSQIDDQDIFRALKAASNKVSNGAILRGSSAPTSPYLMGAQLFHKSTILVLQDTSEASIGVILNLPTKDAYILRVGDTDYTFPIRYGGYSGKIDSEDSRQYFWFHDHPRLKEEEFGLPVSFSNESPETTWDDTDCIYACDFREVAKSIELGLATPDDFLLVKGFCAWEKQSDSAGGLTGEISNGNLEDTQWFQKTPEDRKRLWDVLRAQRQPQSEDCLKDNLALTQKAWDQGGVNDLEQNDSENDCQSRKVFDSDISIADLADEALFVWMKLFLLRDAVYYPTDL